MGRYGMNRDVSVLKGKTLLSVVKSQQPYGEDEILFTTTEGKTYKMYHSHDCCEDVSIEEIHGDLEDLVGNPIEVAEERTSEDFLQTDAESQLWTFYEFRTIKGSVTIRWYGTSNGYYSEGVDFCEMT
jgi:hypothetical protein